MGAITQTYQDKVSDHQFDSFVPGAGNLVINQWFIGTEFKTNSNVKVELWLDMNGDGKHLQFIDRIFTSKATYQKSLSVNLTTNANSKITVKRYVEGKKGPREIFARWMGVLS